MRAHAALTVAASLLALAFAGCLGGVDPAATVAPNAAPESEPEPRVVVAVIDTGMNFFHEAFRRDGMTPPAYLPVDAIPLALDFNGSDWEKVVETNRKTLDAIEKGKLYTIPGTKVVGAISFQDKVDDWPLILDYPGVYTHGTMTTSRAVGTGIAIGGDDAAIDLVIVQGFSIESVEWAAAQPWIDMISISAGISPYGIVPGVPNALDAGAVEAYQAAALAKPFFASTGNGVGNAGVAGFPSWLRGSSGAPDVISVGANANDKMSHWHNFDPYISADGCGNPQASESSMDEVVNEGGGTSSATPFSAGGGAKLLLEARRVLGNAAVGPATDAALPIPEGSWDSLAPTDGTVVLARAADGAMLPATGPLADGAFTLRELKDVLYHTALPIPTDDESDGDPCETTAGGFVPGDAAPEDQRFAFQGYGEVNALSIEHAIQVIKGEADALARPGADAEYARAHAIKTQMAETV